ncbi:MAG: hypothetical protein L0211_07470 [Planctomycetaceae bacterium]|nr:hypothetical protein [Planctomycetaceae bacterium]
MSEHDGNAGGSVLGVACPGGMARQYRVQERDELMPHLWRLVGSYRHASQAHAVVEQLAKTGTTCRVVDCKALPTPA